MSAGFGIFVVLLLLFAVVSMIWSAYSASEQARRNQQADALLATVEQKGKHADLLTEAVGHLKSVFDIIHAEHVELAGYRAELTYTLGMAEALKKGRVLGSTGQRGFEKEQLGHARDVLRMGNDVADAKDRAALRPLRMEAQRAGLLVRADKRVIERTLVQNAVIEAQRRGGELVQPDHLTSSIAELVEAAEARKADGEDAGDIEHAIQTLRALTAKNGKEPRS